MMSTTNMLLFERIKLNSLSIYNFHKLLGIALETKMNAQGMVIDIMIEIEETAVAIGQEIEGNLNAKFEL